MLNRWLSYLKQDTRINQIGIPGTHDTASVTGTVATHKSNNLPDTTSMPLTYTQQLDVKSQLDNGARVLDMRVAYFRQEAQEAQPGSWLPYSAAKPAKPFIEEVYMCHGPMLFTGITLDATLAIVKQFLIDHPSEFVALMFQQQGADPDPLRAEHATKFIRDKVLAAFGPNYLFHPNQAGGEWPTIGEVKTKAMLFSRLRHYTGTCFFDVRAWGDNSVNQAFDVAGTSLKIRLQDRYTKVTTANAHTTQNYHSNFGSSADNVTSAKLHVFKAMSNVGNAGNMLKINHLSHSLKSYTYSQPYMLGQLANPLLQESLDGGDRYLGFLMLDDLNEDLCQDIVDSNANYFRVGREDKFRGQRAKLMASIPTD